MTPADVPPPDEPPSLDPARVEAHARHRWRLRRVLLLAGCLVLSVVLSIAPWNGEPDVTFRVVGTELLTTDPPSAPVMVVTVTPGPTYTVAPFAVVAMVPRVEVSPARLVAMPTVPLWT